MSRGWKIGLITMSLAALALCGLAFRSQHKTRLINAAIETERRGIEELAFRVETLAAREIERKAEANVAAQAVDSSVLGVLNRLEVYSRRVGVRCTDISQPPDMLSATHVFHVAGQGAPASVTRFFSQIEQDRGPLAVEQVRLFHDDRQALLFEATILSPKERAVSAGALDASVRTAEEGI